MPVYEFACKNKKCKHEYAEFVHKYDPDGKYPDVKCPKCNSKRKTKLISHFDVQNTSSRNAIFSNLAGKNMEKATDCRRQAEEASHMGATPYGAGDAAVADIESLGEGLHDPEFRPGLL